MNLVPIIGAYAAICTEEGLPFSFTGGVPYVWEAVDARLVAEVIEWAGASPAAANEHFNLTNGDVFEWRNLWPGMAEVLGVEPGPDDPKSMAQFLEDKHDVWDRIVQKKGLRPIPLRNILGESHDISTSAPPMGQPRCPRRRSRAASNSNRRASLACHDTQETFNYWLRDLIHRRVIPGPASSAA